MAHGFTGFSPWVGGSKAETWWKGLLDAWQMEAQREGRHWGQEHTLLGPTLLPTSNEAPLRTTHWALHAPLDHSTDEHCASMTSQLPKPHL